MRISKTPKILLRLLTTGMTMATMLALPVVGAAKSSGPLVSTDWVAQKMEIIQNSEQTQIRLVDVGQSYKKGFIPGAVNILWGGEIFSQATDHMVLGLAEMERVAKKLGITPDTHIVIYDGDNKPHHITRAYWTLKYWNFDNVSIMDGGIAKWQAEGRKLTTQEPGVGPRDYQVEFPPNASVRARLTPEVIHGLATKTSVFVDSRHSSFWEGKQYVVKKWIRGGTIPGAVNVFTMQSLNQDGTFRAVDQLKKMYAKAGVGPEKGIITFCDTGVLATHSWFVLSELMGYDNVMVYDGSMREYANRFDLPMMNSSIAPGFPLKGALQDALH